MKINILAMVAATALAGLFTACNDYLDNMPKGQKIPVTLSDYNNLIADEYTCQRVPVDQAVILMNDRYVTPYYLNYYPLWKANYNWDETINRVKENKADESTYYTTYAAISTANLILENAQKATEATPKQRAELEAQARFLRAESYFVLVNYYARNYRQDTAEKEKGVPVILSAMVGAAYEQPSVAQVYNLILDDVEKAIADLPAKAANVLYADVAAGHALAARVYLQMGRYNDALTHADMALQSRSELFNWVDFYKQHEELINNPESYQTYASPMGFDFVENYNFRHGESSYSGNDNPVTVERAKRFEDGDAAFLCRWKLRTVGADTYYQPLLAGFNNKGGITTTEVWLIKAECLARNNSLEQAMEVVNKVRKMRMLPNKFVPLTANTSHEALRIIRQVKANALIQTFVPFCDARRMNMEPQLAQTLTKTVNGQVRTLAPDAYFWVMPFPQGAIENHGNGNISQNVDK